MTGIIKTDQLQGAQSTTITIPTGNKISITDSATIGTLNATTMKGVTTFADSAVFSGHLSTSQTPNLNGFRYSTSSVTTVSSAVSSIDLSVPANTSIVTVVYNQLSQSSSGEIYFRVSNGSYLTSGYEGGSMYVNSSSSQGATNYTGQFGLAYGFTATDNSLSGIAQFATTTTRQVIYTNTVNSGNYASGTIHACGRIDLGDGNTLAGIRIYPNSGNIDSGTVKCYFS